MRFEPTPEAFAAAYTAGRPQVVWTTLVADLETPVSAYLKLAEGRTNTFLLESVEGGVTRGRYSMIGLKPDLIWRCEGKSAEINRTPDTAPDAFEPTASAAARFAARAAGRIRDPDARHICRRWRPACSAISRYDMVRHMEELPEPNPDVLGVPDALMMRPTVMVIFDAVKDEITIVTPARPEAGSRLRRRPCPRAGAYSRSSSTRSTSRCARSRPTARSIIRRPISSRTRPRPNIFRWSRRAKEYIAAGDIFQVVLSQRFEAPFELPPFALYRALRRVNPAPFLVYLDCGGFQIVCSSPEILVRSRDGVVTIRPIAGTRPRGATPAEDRQFADDLLADPKERAEHLMLLDLGRNDVGRVAEIGTVEVTDQFFLEYYSHVMHIVSNVEGKLAAGHDALDALIAGFPAGTVSGAPKVRAMEIIDELEKEKRGVYAGCVGYFGANGAMDTCIALRTSVVKNGKMYAQAGAGIVADSVPESENAECINKARAQFRAAEEAVRFASQAKRGQ